VHNEWFQKDTSIQSGIYGLVDKLLFDHDWAKEMRLRSRTRDQSNIK
jgi:hypothetical protein